MSQEERFNQYYESLLESQWEQGFRDEAQARKQAEEIVRYNTGYDTKQLRENKRVEKKEQGETKSPTSEVR